MQNARSKSYRFEDKKVGRLLKEQRSRNSVIKKRICGRLKGLEGEISKLYPCASSSHG
jgi:hypothetical protein